MDSLYQFTKKDAQCFTFLLIYQDWNKQNMSSNIFVYLCFCLSNAITFIIPILQDSHHPRNRPDTVFYHPLMQTEVMVIGQMLCLFIYLSSKHKTRPDDERPRAPLLVCFIPLALDLAATSLEMVALNYLSGSVFTITSSIVIVTTAAFTKVLLRKTFHNSQIVGCLFAIAGVAVTGYAEYSLGNSSTPKELLSLGLALTLVAYTIEGLEMVAIEIIFTKYSITPLEFVGKCGTAGTIIWTLVMIIVSGLGCPFSDGQCVSDYTGGKHLEHIPSYLLDLRGDTFLSVLVGVHLLIQAWYNYNSCRVIQIANAMVYEMVNIFTNCFVWIGGIIITLLANGNEEFMIEDLGIEVILMKCGGYMLAVIGLLLYNQIIFKEKDKAKEEFIDIPIGGQDELQKDI